MNVILELPLQAKVVAGLLVILILWFLVRYVAYGLAQRFKLNQAIRALREAVEKEPKTFASIFERDKKLAHLWREYEETLHEQKELNSQTGTYEVTKYRSTVPAEVFFSREVLVDTVLATEFFKHLPGIFTGLGIIGTFIGLIGGINAFTVSDNSQIVRDGLNALLHDVSQAFTISFFAIAAAMVVTFIEKMLVSGLYGCVENLCQVIDEAFEAGAGEEYLARLVRSSESAEKETIILKDSLVSQLSQVLESLTERQIQQSSFQAERIVEGLTDPLNKIGDAVQVVGGNQAEAVHKILVDTMTALTSQIKDLFGDQIRGINSLQQETVVALQNSLGRLDELTVKMGQTGTSSTEQMAQTLGEAIGGMEARQRAINDELMKVVASVRRDVSESQAETNRKMQESISAMSASVTDVVRGMESLIDAASSRDQVRNDALVQHAHTTQETMSANLERTLMQVGDVGEAIKYAVQRMEQITTEALSRMNEGANTLYIAASDFAKAGSKTSETLDKASVLTGQLSTASAALTGSSNTLSSAIVDYKSVRDEVSHLVSELRATVEAAKMEATLTADVLARIEGATQRLIEAEREAEQYLEQVSNVLAKAHGEFASNIVSTLRQANMEFHQHLTIATKMLGDTVDGLSDVLERVPTK
jgi:hypothetical protein